MTGEQESLFINQSGDGRQAEWSRFDGVGRTESFLLSTSTLCPPPPVVSYSWATGTVTETWQHTLTVQSGTCCYVTTPLSSFFFLLPLPPDSYHMEAVTPPAHYLLSYYLMACGRASGTRVSPSPDPLCRK